MLPVKVDQEKMSLELCKQFSFLISRLRLDKLAIIADIFIMYISVGLSIFSRITHIIVASHWWRNFFFFNTLNPGQFLWKNRTALFLAEVSLTGGFAAFDWKIETKLW